jgi:hypothetical protein
MVEPARVAVVEVSDDANEDRWADAFWQAECAARQAAVAAGAESDKLTVERDHRGSVIVRGSDGRAFQALVRTTRSMHPVQLPHVARPE